MPDNDLRAVVERMASEWEDTTDYHGINRSHAAQLRAALAAATVGARPEQEADDDYARRGWRLASAYERSVVERDAILNRVEDAVDLLDFRSGQGKPGPHDPLIRDCVARLRAALAPDTGHDNEEGE